MTKEECLNPVVCRGAKTDTKCSSCQNAVRRTTKTRNNRRKHRNPNCQTDMTQLAVRKNGHAGNTYGRRMFGG